LWRRNSRLPLWRLCLKQLPCIATVKAWYGVAVNLSAVRAIKKMILVTPFYSILNVAQDIYWMFPLSFLLKDKFESWRKVEGINVDSLLIIAEQDEVIAPKYGHNLANYFASKPKLKVKVIIGAGHNNIAEFMQ